MSYSTPSFGNDFDLERYSFGDRDAAGHLVWFKDMPHEDDWSAIRIVTLNLSPEGEPMYRNYYIHKDRPLDPPLPHSQQGPYHYDITDIAANSLSDYDIDFGGGGGVPIDYDEPPPPPEPPRDEPDDYEPPPRKRPKVKQKRSLVARVFRRLFGLRG